MTDPLAVCYLVAYALTGAFAGLVAGLLGVGGGVVNVPILDVLFRQQGVAADPSFHLALGTSLAAIVFTSAAACWVHYRHDKVDVGYGLTLGFAGMGGSFVGGWLASALTSTALKPAFALLLIASGLQLIFDKQAQRPGPPGARWIAAPIGLAAGVLAGFFGVGGGIIAVPMMLWFGRFAPGRAVATSSLMIVLLGAAGAVSFVITGWGRTANIPWALGHVHLLALIFLTPASIITARFGARLAHRVNPLRLKRLFALALFAVGVRFLWVIFEKG